MDLVVVQHAEKIQAAGDHGLTAQGRLQAEACGRKLARFGPFDAMFTSPLVRARRTARIISAEVPLLDPNLVQDARLSERINWWDAQAQSAEAFAREWEHSTRDRDYRPDGGDSSRATGLRMADFALEQMRRFPSGRVIAVSHGGATLDLVRTWFGEDNAEALLPGALERGLPPCGITWIEIEPDLRKLRTLGSLDLSTLLQDVQ